MKCIDLLLLFIVILVQQAFCQRKISPCPTVFTYDLESDTSDSWYGTLKLQTSVPLHGVTIDVIFDKRAESFTAYYFNDVTTSDYKQFRVENNNFKLDPGRTLVMNFHVRFDNQVPLMKQVRLNGQNICVDLPITAVQPIYASNSNLQPSTSTKRTTRRENPSFNNDGFNDYTTTYRNTFATSTQAWNHVGNRGVKTGNAYDDNNFSQFSGLQTSRPNTESVSKTGRDVQSSGSNFNSGRESAGSNTNSDPWNSGSNTNKGRDTSNSASNTNNGREIYTSGTSSNHNNNNNDYNNDRDSYVPSNTGKAGSNNQGRDIYQPSRETSTNGNSFGFVADSLAGSANNANGNNHNSVPQRPVNRPTTTTTTSTTAYDFTNNRRTTASTQWPNRATTTRKSTYFQGDLPFFNNDETSTHSILNLDGDSQCGTVIPKVNPLIVHGEETYQGQFPWHAAIYLSDVGSLKYICGGSLVSMNAIVTAAHCVTHEKSKRAIGSNNVLVYLGKSSLRKWTGPEQDAKVGEIVINPDYNPERFYGDIAVLKLKETLMKTNYVRPLCIWNIDTDLKLIVNKLGLVPGWGYNENGLVSEDLSYVKMPVVTHETCIWSNSDFFSKVTSEKSFCAGFRNGTSICNGDSGGGMVFKQGKQFYLRGIVSISIALQNSLKCDPNHYAVFVDAAKYSTWIKQNI